MHIKNDRAMLVLLAVAAMAIASVAGMAFVSSDSSGDDPVLTVVGTNTIFSENNTTNYGVHAGAADSVTVTINADKKYNAVLYFGTYYGDVFAPLVKLNLVNVDGVVLKYASCSDRVVVTGKTAGTITVTAGAVICGGTTAGTYFTGTVAGNTVSAAFANVYSDDERCMIRAGTTDVLSGSVAKGSQTKEGGGTADSTLAISGDAYVSDFTVGSGVDVSVASGATVTGDRVHSKPYSFTAGREVKMNIGLAAGTNKAVGWICDSNGTIIAQSENATVTAGVMTMKVDTGKTLSGNGKYTMYAALDDGTNVCLYRGEFTFGSSIAGIVITATPNLSVSSAIVNSTEYAVTGGTDIGYGTGLVCLFAAVYDGSDAFRVINTGTAQTISVTGLADGDNVVFILKNKATGAYTGFHGKYVAAENKVSSSKVVSALLVGQPDVAKTLSPTSVTGVSEVPYITLSAAASSLAVAGTLDLKYAFGMSDNFVSNSGKITVTGTMKYQTNKTSSPLLCGSGYSVNAASYRTEEADSNPSYTYRYVNLASAMGAAKSFSVFGTVPVLADTALAGTPAGTASQKNVITIENNSVLEVGKSSAAGSATAVVTVPATTQLAFAGNGKIDVKNGQLKIAGETAARAMTVVKANVFFDDGTDGVYTEIMTALNLAKSGDTVVVRTGSGDIDIDRNAEVKAGVILDPRNSSKITVKAGSVFTVAGSMMLAPKIDVEAAEGGSAPKDAAVLLLKNKDVKITVLELRGVLELANGFDNTAADETGFGITTLNIYGTSSAASVIKVGGKANVPSLVKPGSTAVAEIDVTGTANFKTGFASAATLNLKLSESGIANIGLDLTVNNVDAVGTSKIAVAAEKVFKISGKGTFGVRPTHVTESATAVDAKNISLDGTGYAVVYGKAPNVTFTPATAKATTAFCFNEDGVKPQWQKVYSAQAYVAPSTGFQLTLTDPEIVGHSFVNWYKEDTFTNVVTSACCGEYASIFGKLSKTAYTVNFPAIVGIKWFLDGKEVSGIKAVDCGEHKIVAKAASGYDTKNVKIKINGEIYNSGATFSLSGNAEITADEPEKKDYTLTYIMVAVAAVIGVAVAAVILKKKGVF